MQKVTQKSHHAEMVSINICVQKALRDWEREVEIEPDR